MLCVSPSPLSESFDKVDYINDIALFTIQQ